jgi:cysteine desulfurase
MPDIAVSAGSACTAASAAPSHVLGAMGLDDAAIGGSIRFSLGRFTTHDDIAYAAARVAVVVELTRRMR